MGLKEVMEETKKQLEDAEKKEANEKPGEEVVKEESKDAPKEEDKKPEEKPEEEKKEEPKEEPKKTPAEYAKERRESKAAKLAEELAAANARIAELTRPKEEPKKEVVPDRTEDPTGWAEYELRKRDERIARLESQTKEITRQEQSKRLREQAEMEVQNYEAQVRQKAPDYDDVKSYYANMLAASIKIVNPRITNDKLVKTVNDRLLLRASELLNEGYENPIEKMYEDAKALGYKPPEKEQTKEEVKPDLSKVAENRKRNAGTAAAQGDSGKGELTPLVASQMTNKEFSKLGKEEKKRLLGGR